MTVISVRPLVAIYDFFAIVQVQLAEALRYRRTLRNSFAHDSLNLSSIHAFSVLYAVNN